MKSNVDHLRQILNSIKSQGQFIEEMEEAIEFADAMESEISDLEIEVREAQENIETEIQKAKDDVIDFETYNVGLDKIYIGTENGNIAIEQRIEQFVNRLKRDYAMLPS